MTLEPNANQSIPELFWEIMRIQDQIDEVKERMVQSITITGTVAHFESARLWKSMQMSELDPLLDHMAELRGAAERFIRPVSPMGSGRPVAMGAPACS